MEVTMEYIGERARAEGNHFGEMLNRISDLVSDCRMRIEIGFL